MVIVWRWRENNIRTALCWIVWHSVHSQQHTYMRGSYRSNRLDFSHWYPYAVCRGGCLEVYYHNMVEWFWRNSSLISMNKWFPSTSGFLQCFDTVCLVIFPVKIVPDIAHNVLSGTLNTNQPAYVIDWKKIQVGNCVICFYGIILLCVVTNVDHFSWKRWLIIQPTTALKILK